MRSLLTSVVGALLLAVLVAAGLSGLVNAGHFYGQAVLMNGLLLLFFGWPEYLLMAATHYWLLRSHATLRRPGWAALVGAALAPSAWGLGVALGLVDRPVSDWALTSLLFSIAGAVYGVSIARLYWRRKQPARFTA